MITKIARHGSPVEHQAWREIIEDFDQRLEFMVEGDEEEALCDQWLDNPLEFRTAEVEESNSSSRIQASMVRRPPTGGFGLRRASDPKPKTAAVNNWDQEFSDAKAHAASVLKNLGNA